MSGRAVQLTYVEFELLRTLASTPGVVYSRQRLLEALWGGSDYREPRTIDVHVRHLREKLEEDPSEPQLSSSRSAAPATASRRAVNPFRSVGARLGLALLVVVAAALGDRLRGVVPILERNLVDNKIEQLDALAEAEAAAFRRRSAPADLRRERLEHPGARAARALLDEGRGGRSASDRRLAATPARQISRPDRGARGSPGRGRQSGGVERDGSRRRGRGAPSEREWSSCLGAARGHALERRPRPAALLLAGIAALLIASPSATGGVPVRAAAPPARARRRSGSRRALRRADRRPGRDEVGELAQAFDRMRCGSPTSSAPGASSSRTPRTSSGRRSSRSAASSSCSRTRTSTRHAARVPRGDAREQVDAPDEARDRPPRPLAARRGPRPGRAGRRRPRRGARTRSRRVPRARQGPSTPLSRPRSTAPRRRVADEQRVLQIARILVENALRHTPPGTPDRSSARRREHGRALAVADDGPGVPPATRSRSSSASTAARAGRPRERARARDRVRARGADGRVDRARSRPGRDRLHAASAARPPSAFSRGNARAAPEEPDAGHYYENAVRPGSLAVVAVVCALLGASSALIVAKAAGWLGDGATRTRRPHEPPAARRPRTTSIDEDAAGEAAAGQRLRPGRDLPRARGGRRDDLRPLRRRTTRDAAAMRLRAPASSSRRRLHPHELARDHDRRRGRPDRRRPRRRAPSTSSSGRRPGQGARSSAGTSTTTSGSSRSSRPTTTSRRCRSATPTHVVVGEPVAAIGSPFGNESSLTVGVVSATERSIASLTSSYDLVDAIQTDAPINRGNSGGPMFDARGRVIGINAQINSDSGNAEGVGFAVPINSARRSMEQLIETGEVRYAWLGVSTQTLTPRSPTTSTTRRARERRSRPSSPEPGGRGGDPGRRRRRRSSRGFRSAPAAT